MFCLDNDAARAALCKGCGGTRLGSKLVQNIMESESTLRLKSWYARAPHHSNISDGPSRLDCTEIRQLGSEEVKVDWSKILENLLQCAFPTWGEHGHTDLSPTALKKGAVVSGVIFRPCLFLEC